MAEFKVTFQNSGEEEFVEADFYSDVRNWIVFYNQRLAEPNVEILRLKAAAISRIERVPDASELPPDEDDTD